MIDKISHGGARPGAGRKALAGPTRTLTLRIPEADLLALEEARIVNLSRFYVDAGKKAINQLQKKKLQK